MTLNVKTQEYFPVQFIVVGIGLTLAGIFIIFHKTWLSAVLIPLGILLSSTHYRVNIDFDKKMVFDYLWIIGFKKGTKNKFKKAEYFYMNSTKFNQTHGSVSVRFHSSGKIFNAYLKLDNENVFLKEGFDKGEIKSFVFSLSHKFNIPYQDYQSDN